MLLEHSERELLCMGSIETKPVGLQWDLYGESVLETFEGFIYILYLLGKYIFCYNVISKERF